MIPPPKKTKQKQRCSYLNSFYVKKTATLAVQWVINKPAGEICSFMPAQSTAGSTEVQQMTD